MSVNKNIIKNEFIAETKKRNYEEYDYSRIIIK